MKPKRLNIFEKRKLKRQFPKKMKKKEYIEYLEKENKRLNDELKTINGLITCEADYKEILEVLKRERV